MADLWQVIKMEYSVKELSQLAGVTARTLRFYDEIGLLTPGRNQENGYRVYDGAQVDRLQQILFLRELGVELKDIKALIQQDDYSVTQTLERHLEGLLVKQTKLASLIESVKASILYYKGEQNMSDIEKFQALKESLIQDNERQFGQEIREKYGAEQVEESNQRMMDMTEEAYREMEAVNKALMEKLKDLLSRDDIPEGDGKEVAALHKKWLSYTWTAYSTQAHIGLVNMYVTDGRFTKYYDDNAGSGAAALLKRLVEEYVEGVS